MKFTIRDSGGSVHGNRDASATPNGICRIGWCRRPRIRTRRNHTSGRVSFPHLEEATDGIRPEPSELFYQALPVLPPGMRVLACERPKGAILTGGPGQPGLRLWAAPKPPVQRHSSAPGGNPNSARCCSHIGYMFSGSIHAFAPWFGQKVTTHQPSSHFGLTFSGVIRRPP